MRQRKRSWKEIWCQAMLLMRQDIKENRMFLFVLALYVLIIKLFFHISCPLVLTTGFPCPACGLTRAGLALLRGDWKGAWQIHAFIYPLAGLVIVAVIWRYFLQKKMEALKWLFAIWSVGLILYYAYRMICFFPGNPPVSYYPNSILSRILRLLP